MKKWKECQHEIALTYGYNNWSELKELEHPQNMDGFYKEVAEFYAQKVGEDVRKRCADNADTIIKYTAYENGPPSQVKIVNQESILKTEIILP